MNKMLDFKSITGDIITDVSKSSRVVSGYLSSFNNVDFHDDIIEPGAFTNTIKQRGSQIFFLNQHNWNQPHGFFKELSEDHKGLKFVSQQMPNTTYSNDALELYAAGIVKEHSIGFNIVKSFIREDGIRVIKEVMLWEGSNVTLGANPETPFTGFKSYNFEELNEEITKFMNVLRNGTVTDDTMKQLEVGLRIMQKHAFNLGKAEALNNSEPDNSTRKTGTEPLVLAIDEYLKSKF